MTCSEPIYQFCKAMTIMACVRDIRLKEVKYKSGVLFIIQYQYNNLFVVKLTVKVDGTLCKAKDVAVFGLSEMQSNPFTDDEEFITKDISSLMLYRQITFAAKRVGAAASLSPSISGT